MAGVQTITVIGAGAMGSSIARLAALGGFRTILQDILPASLRRAQQEIHRGMDNDQKGGAVDSEVAEAALRRLEYASDIDHAAREADFVIEAVPEELESKIEIFTLLDRTCRPNTILVSSTSNLSVTEIASVTYRAAHIAGMRFIGDPQTEKQVEVVRALETDEPTLAAVAEVATRMGKEVVVVRESPGS